MSTDDPTLLPGSVVALVEAGFGVGENPGAVLLAGLDEPVAHTRILAVRGLRRQGLLTLDLWRRALHDADPDVRRETLVELAASAPEPSLTTDVLRALDDDDPLVVDAALFVVNEHEIHEGLTRCCELASQHEDARVREGAVATLGALGDEAGLATILAAFDDKPPVRRRAVVALANFEGPEVDVALARAREDRDWQVRAAAEALSE